MSDAKRRTLGKIEISIRDMPEALADMRRELANVLRSTAAAEHVPIVRRRLEQVAAAFECGQANPLPEQMETRNEDDQC